MNYTCIYVHKCSNFEALLFPLDVTTTKTTTVHPKQHIHPMRRGMLLCINVLVHVLISFMLKILYLILSHSFAVEGWFVSMLKSIYCDIGHSGAFLSLETNMMIANII